MKINKTINFHPLLKLNSFVLLTIMLCRHDSYAHLLDVFLAHGLNSTIAIAPRTAIFAFQNTSVVVSKAISINIVLLFGAVRK